MTLSQQAQPYDAVVVGAGPAGLQAAITLGRMRRPVLLLDSGEYRNAAAGSMHNFLTHDGTPPAEFRAAARRDLGAYDTVTIQHSRATRIDEEDEHWRVTVGEDHPVVARTVLLATGLRDTLPDVPGLAQLWGDVVAHCPYCHGHEMTGKPVALLGIGPHTARLVALLTRISARTTVLADGAQVDAGTAAQLADLGAEVRAETVAGVCRSAAGAAVSFEGGPEEQVGGLFVSTALSQAAPFAAQLDLDMLPSGCVRIDTLGRASRPGVYAAGDLAHLESLPMPLASVLTASAAGLLAATSIDQDLMVRDHLGDAPSTASPRAS